MADSGFKIWASDLKTLSQPYAISKVGEFGASDTAGQGGHTVGQGGQGGGIPEENSGSSAWEPGGNLHLKCRRETGGRKRLGETQGEIAVLGGGDLFIYQGEQRVCLGKYERETPNVG